MMKKGFCGAALAMALVCLTLAGVPARAAGLSIAPTVSVRLEGSEPKTPDEFAFELTADGEDAPMPADSVGLSSRAVTTGAGTAAFGEILFDRVGVYAYTLKQIPGDNPDCAYDGTVYHMTVYVVNGAQGDFEAIVILRCEGEDEKKEPLFVNVYEAGQPDPPPDKPPKTGVEDNWPFYLIGCVVMLFISGLMARVLLRRDKDDEKR